MHTCSNQAVKPAFSVLKVIYNQWIRTAEQIQQHKEVLEAKRLKMQLMTDNVNFNISHELTGNNNINSFRRTINHPEKQPAHLTRINVHPSEIKSALRKENMDTHRDGIDLSLIRANAGTQVLYKNSAISDTGVYYLNLIVSIFLC